MTLYKQLLTWSMGIFITISVVLFALEFHHTRNDLIEQQTVRFDDTLNAATFALSPYLQGDDLEEAQTIIKKIFDNHNYQSTTLISITSSEAIKLNFKEPKNSIPSWFMTLSNIKPIQKTVQISSNWQPLANLKVINRPTFVYEKLWNNTKSILFALTFCGVILIVGLSIVFRRILVPLQIIQVSAQNLANNKFDEVLETSKYRELNDVVSVFNQITKQLRTHFEQQSEEANKLRVRAYQDPVSGLANRKYMMTQLKSWIESGSTGGIALLKVDQLDDVYEKEGYIQGDELTRSFAASLMEISSDEFNIARLNNSEFMLLAPNISDEDMLELGRAMLNRVAELQNDPLDIAPLQAAVALIMKQTDDSISDLLARADNGLVQARANREEPMFLVLADSDESQPNFGKQQWKAIVDEAIANKEFIFNYQKAIDSNNQMLHQEVFAAIQKTTLAIQQVAFECP
ncbi:LapD/MoxY N-terminal periplasmic domain-containing protein [Vibrio rumoiensis]|uniref:LapD/MoxY N-terminal periplasmic domain-containing protein n=1 Tax=Vibrio rumoiensis TaxID=76258 RepID=UPI0013A53BB3|nr:LapD/MoxY N-terminal periplasmic domain-containing protein [Vibrio rumoiensis]